ncbi:hypothetical protein GCM10010269_48070 [Streptomyces humidus]|uniref:Uncharacterized protein n=1 Tax=Streptomyces humidus TaxID=52259 RepID=A0A918FYM2_9ACTN|nr:hypothetical protein GCM10010269_48070 [Streptomyces humidus]
MRPSWESRTPERHPDGTAGPPVHAEEHPGALSGADEPDREAEEVEEAGEDGTVRRTVCDDTVTLVHPAGQACLAGPFPPRGRADRPRARPGRGPTEARRTGRLVKVWP